MAEGSGGHYDSQKRLEKFQKRCTQAVPLKKGKTASRLQKSAQIATAAALGTLATSATIRSGAIEHTAQVLQGTEAHAEQQETKKEEALVTKKAYTNLLTKDPNLQQAARTLINEEHAAVERIATIPLLGERESIKVVRKWKNKIIEEAHKNSLSPQIAMAIAFIENGGSENEVSSEGAVGIFQLLEDAARQTGVIYEKEGETIDERRIPTRNIEGGVAYLALQRDLLRDEGLSVLAYYTGYSTVVKLLHHHSGNTLLGEKDSLDDFEIRERVRKFVRDNHITAYTLLKDIPGFAKEQRKKLPPAIMEYVPRVAAAAEYLVEKGIVEPEKVAINVPDVPLSYPKSLPAPPPSGAGPAGRQGRTDGAVV